MVVVADGQAWGGDITCTVVRVYDIGEKPTSSGPRKIHPRPASLASPAIPSKDQTTRTQAVGLGSSVAWNPSMPSTSTPQMNHHGSLEDASPLFDL